MSSVEQFCDLPCDVCLPLSAIHLSSLCAEQTLRMKELLKYIPQLPHGYNKDIFIIPKPQKYIQKGPV